MLTKYYSETTIRRFIEMCQNAKGQVDLAKLDNYLNSPYDFNFKIDDNDTVYRTYWYQADGQKIVSKRIYPTLRGLKLALKPSGGNKIKLNYPIHIQAANNWFDIK